MNEPDPSQDIGDICDQMITIVKGSDERRKWVAKLTELRNLVAIDPDKACECIAAMYGGMGALNDTPIYANGVYKSEETKVFEELARQLWKKHRQLCRPCT